MRCSFGVVPVLVALILVAGCNSGSGGGGGGGGGGPDAILEGTVFDCVTIRDAVIEIRIILPGTNALGRVLGTTTSGPNGEFSANLGNFTGFVHADASGGSFNDPFQGALTLTERLESIVFVQAGSTSTVVISASTTFAVRLKLRLGRDPATDIATDIYNVERVFADFTGVRNVFTTLPNFQPTSGDGFDHLMLNTGFAEWSAAAGVNPAAGAKAASEDATDYRMDGFHYDDPVPLNGAFMPTSDFAQTLGQAVRNGASFLGYDIDATDVDETLLAEDNQFRVPPADLTIRNFYDDGNGNGFGLIWGAMGSASETDVDFIPAANGQAFPAQQVGDLLGGGLGVQPPSGLAFGSYIVRGTDIATGIRWKVPGFRVADLDAAAQVTEFQPANGPAAGRSRIRFRGTTLSEMTEVRIGGNLATHTNAKPGEWIECLTPAGSGLADITLTNPGTQPLTLSAAYRYDTDGVGLDGGFNDNDQALVGGRFFWNGMDYTVECFRYKLGWIDETTGTYAGPRVRRSMMAPDAVQTNEGGSVFRARQGRDAVFFTIGEGLHRFRVNEKHLTAYGLRDNGISYVIPVPSNATQANVSQEPFHIVGFLVDVTTKEHTTVLGVGRLHPDGTGEVAGHASTRDPINGEVGVDVFATDITEWNVDPDGLISGLINLPSGEVPFNGQTDADLYPRYFWSGCPGQMVLLFANPVHHGFEPQDASGNWVGGDLGFTFDGGLEDNYSLGYSFTRFLVDDDLERAYLLAREEGDRGFSKEGFDPEFVEVLRGPQGVTYGSTGVAHDLDTGERLGTFDARTQGAYVIRHPDEDGMSRPFDFTWGALGWVPERYTAGTIRGTHLKATASGFNPVISDPPDLSWFKTLSDSRRDFDPDAYLQIDGRDLDRVGTMFTIDSAEDQKRTDRVSGTGEAFFQVGTNPLSLDLTYYYTMDEDVIITDDGLRGLRIGAATADCTVLSLRDFGTGDVGAFTLFVQESTQTPPCANGTYCIGGLFLEFDNSSLPAVGTLTAVRGEVRLDQPGAGQVTLDLDFLDKAEDGSEGPPDSEVLTGTYTCAASGRVTITVPLGGGDPDLVLQGFATPDGQMIYLQDFSANTQVGIAMLVRKGAGTPPLIDYYVAGVDFEFVGAPAVPRRENATLGTSIVTTRLPGALNVLGTSRTRSNFMVGVMPGQTVLQATLNALAGGGLEYNLDPAGANLRFLGALSANGRFGVALLGNPDLTDTSIRFFFPR